ncbi:hypothetical protein MMC07_000378 [Pseudocyphellaria aurata]|nr:hypothetical protein [Pseudocyphellaria aurata]
MAALAVAFWSTQDGRSELFGKVLSLLKRMFEQQGSYLAWLRTINYTSPCIESAPEAALLLQLAVNAGSMEHCRILVQHGARVWRACDPDSISAMQRPTLKRIMPVAAAFQKGNMALARLLLSIADPTDNLFSARLEDPDYWAFHVLETLFASPARPRQAELSRLLSTLAQHSVLLTPQECDQLTPLMLACQLGYAAGVQAMTGAGLTQTLQQARKLAMSHQSSLFLHLCFSQSGWRRTSLFEQWRTGNTFCRKSVSIIQHIHVAPMQAHGPAVPCAWSEAIPAVIDKQLAAIQAGVNNNNASNSAKPWNDVAGNTDVKSEDNAAMFSKLFTSGLQLQVQLKTDVSLHLNAVLEAPWSKGPYRPSIGTNHCFGNACTDTAHSGDNAQFSEMSAVWAVVAKLRKIQYSAQHKNVRCGVLKRVA